MTGTTSPALQTALAYHEAWTSHDVDTAMSYVAPDIVCDAPPGRLQGADAYRGFLAPFVQILTGSKLIAAFGDDETALMIYDTETVPVQSAPGAECITVQDGKITYSRFIFDRAPSTRPGHARAELDRAGSGSAQARRGPGPLRWSICAMSSSM